MTILQIYLILAVTVAIIKTHETYNKNIKMQDMKQFAPILQHFIRMLLVILVYIVCVIIFPLIVVDIIAYLIKKVYKPKETQKKIKIKKERY